MGAAIDHQRFGTTELTLSRLGFGCARLGGIFGGTTRAEQLNVLRRAFDGGVNFYDTADMYSQGESERLLGEAFRHDRARVVIASKAGYCLPSRRRFVARLKPVLRPLIQQLGLRRDHLPVTVRGTLTQDFSPAYLAAAVEGSLRRLGTDYLDLFQLHSPPRSVLEAGEYIAVLERLRRAGKVRYYGVSCESPGDALVCLRSPEIAVLQVRLNLLDQRMVAEVLPMAAAQGVGVIARECFAGGLLTKRVENAWLETFIPDVTERAARLAEVDHFRSVAEAHGRSLSELALQFVLGTSGVATALAGMRTAAHLAQNLALCLAKPLSPDERATLRAV